MLEPSFPVTVVRRVLSDEKDMLGNEVWVDEEREILVYGWSVPQSSEPKLAWQIGRASCRERV